MNMRWILRLYIFTLFITLCFSQAVSWKVVTPVGLGCDVNLFCNASGFDECCTSNTRQWSRTVMRVDVKPTVLTLNGVSSYPDKFIEVLKPTGFNLIIKNLNKSDVDVFYTCSYGFYSSKSKQMPTYLNNSYCTNTGNEKKKFYLSSVPVTIILYATILLF